jgi:crotonobetainyl-CoA:carnitine CoA-transferase CaiB-like acyl-CoA transferase
VRRPAPQLGEHNDELLREAGYDDAQIAALKANGVLAAGRPRG